MKKLCFFCKSKLKIHKHHIIPKMLKGEDKENNLLFLCSICHIKLHSKLINPVIRYFKEKISREFVLKNNVNFTNEDFKNRLASLNNDLSLMLKDLKNEGV